jgi:ribosomal-protein-alanine N-acetyltransferase
MISAIPSNLVIRPMRQVDLSQVVTIDHMSFSMPWPESAFHYELNENQQSLLWVAEVSNSDGTGTIVGAIVVWLILDEAHIATIAVHPDHREKGIGSKLLETALIESIHLGMHQATLEVRAGNFAAQAMYRKFGFEVVGERRRYYRDNNEDALIMTLKNLDHVEYKTWLLAKQQNSREITQPNFEQP